MNHIRLMTIGLLALSLQACDDQGNLIDTAETGNDSGGITKSVVLSDAVPESAVNQTRSTNLQARQATVYVNPTPTQAIDKQTLLSTSQVEHTVFD